MEKLPTFLVLTRRSGVRISRVSHMSQAAHLFCHLVTSRHGLVVFRSRALSRYSPVTLLLERLFIDWLELLPELMDQPRRSARACQARALPTTVYGTVSRISSRGFRFLCPSRAIVRCGDCRSGRRSRSNPNEGRQKAHARQIGIEASTEFIFAAGIPRRGATLQPRCQD